MLMTKIRVEVRRNPRTGMAYRSSLVKQVQHSLTYAKYAVAGALAGLALVNTAPLLGFVHPSGVIEGASLICGGILMMALAKLVHNV